MAAALNLTTVHPGLSNGTDEEGVGGGRPQLSLQFYLLQAVLVSFLMISTIIGNILISVVISRIKAWEYATGIFVSSLVVADLLRGLTVMPFILLHSLFWRQWDLSGPFCNLSGFTNTLLLNASVLTLAAVAIDRYVVIVKPLEYVTYVTPNRAVVLVGVTWVLALGDALVPLLGRSVTPFTATLVSTCTTTWHRDGSYSTVSFIIIFCVPFAILLFCYWKIFCACRLQKRRIDAVVLSTMVKSSGYNVTHIAKYGADEFPHRLPMKKEKRSAIVLSIVIGVFIFCITPLQVIKLWHGRGHFKMFSDYFAASATLVSFANSAANPLIYGILNRNFRQTFLRLICQRDDCWGRPSRVGEEEELPGRRQGSVYELGDRELSPDISSVSNLTAKAAMFYVEHGDKILDAENEPYRTHASNHLMARTRRRRASTSQIEGKPSAIPQRRNSDLELYNSKSGNRMFSVVANLHYGEDVIVNKNRAKGRRRSTEVCSIQLSVHHR